MPALIKNYLDLRDDLAANQELTEIFFESSTKKDFKDEEERRAFHWKYLGYYLSTYPQYAWVALDKGVLGYLVGTPVSDTSELVSLQPHLAAFKEFYSDYPAHLHINCHARSRGLGIGTLLTLKFIEQLQNEKCKGLHIMTGVGSANCSFYRKLGFDFEQEKPFGTAAIYFMGKSLTDN